MKVLIAAKQVLIIKSSITPENVNLLKAHKPSALTLVDATTKEPLFSAAISASEPSITNNGILVHAKRDFTRTYDKPIEEAAARKEYGVALARLAALEAQVATEVAAIEAMAATATFEAVDFTE